MDYVVWEPYYGEKYCVLKALMGVDRDWELSEGIPQLNSFPDDAYFEMDPNFRKQIKLADILDNQNGLICISLKVKEFLESKQLEKVEFHPVKIIDHKEKVASDEYFILNSLFIQDVLDVEKSKITWNPIDPKSIVTCRKPIFKDLKFEAEAPLIWRLKYSECTIFIAKSLAEEMTNLGFTNNHFIPVDKLKIK